MEKIESFKDLIAYKKGYQLAIQIYRMTKHFPPDEQHGLTSQLRRAAISIPSNIAEGYRRNSRTEYVRFLRIAFGSCGELEAQLDLCRDIDLIGTMDHAKLLALQSEVSKILGALIRSLKGGGMGIREWAVGSRQ